MSGRHVRTYPGRAKRQTADLRALRAGLTLQPAQRNHGRDLGGVVAGVDASRPWQVGDELPLPPELFGDCPAEHVPGDLPIRVSCVLDAGHCGPHIAADGEVVVEIWE